MSADGIIFNSIFPVWITVSVALALLFFFIYNETKRKHRFLTLRIITQIIIIISLTALILRPSVKSEKTSGSALLLTVGYDKEVADSLIAKHRLHTVRMFDAAAYPKSRLISSWHELGKEATAIRFVIGEGVPSFALDENGGMNFTYVGGEKPNGITSIDLQPLKANQRNSIHGEHFSQSEEVALKLVGPGGKEDSVLLKGKGLKSFSLHLKTAQPGSFVYQLSLKEKDQAEKAENLPVQIEAENKLNVLFLQQYPTFETKYLKNYLSEKGHAITLRYQVSKNTYRYEYANHEKQVIPKLTTSLLSSLDALILTTSSLQDLSTSEIQTLEQSIKSGLGVLLLFDQKTTKNIQRIFSLELVPVKTDTVTLASTSWSEKITLPAVPIRVNESALVQSVFKDNGNKNLSGYFYNGTGKIGFQFLNETYRLSLEGKADEYADLWSPLVENIARTKSGQFKIKITTPFPRYVDQPIDFQVISSDEAPELYYDSIRLPLKEDVTIDNVWHGTVWANHPGWHKFALQDSSQFQFYVSADSEWNDLRIANQIQENSAYQSKEELKNSLITEYQPISPFLFFLLFVLASGTLWLAAKM